MDKVNWLILDTLSDDYESMNQIYPIEGYPNISRIEVINRLFVLYHKGYIEMLGDKRFSIDDIKSEPLNYPETLYWFGLTDKGCEVWEKYSPKYIGYSQDWSDSWRVQFDIKNCSGEILSTSEELCKKMFTELVQGKRSPVNVKISPVEESVEIQRIKEFRVKYYKTIKDGFRLSFKFDIL